MPQEIDVKVKEVIQRTPTVKSVRLDIEGAEFKAGQFMRVSLRPEPAYTRYLSISNSPTEKQYIEFTKRITESEFSKALNSLKVSDSLHVQYPMGKFTLEDNPAGKIAFLSGGIGITPIRSMCKYSIDKKLGLDIILLYANRSVREIVFREDFEEMQKQGSGLRVKHVVCEAEPGFECTVGRINAQVVKDEIPDFSERKFFLCGPPGMVEAMQKLLREEIDLPKGQVVTENFIGY